MRKMYGFDSRIRYSEVDETQRLSLVGILNYFQDCSTFQSDDLDIGMDYLKAMDLAWVLNCWQIDVARYPHEGERVRIETVPYRCQSFLGYRNYAMYDEAGKRIAVANTIWTMLNMTTGKPADIPEKVLNAYDMEEKLDMDYLPRKIRPDTQGEQGREIIVSRHHLDANHHVNNGMYVSMAMDFLPEGKKVARLRTEYKAQAKLGNRILPMLYYTAENCIVSLNDEHNNPYAVVDLIYGE